MDSSVYFKRRYNEQRSAAANQAFREWMNHRNGYNISGIFDYDQRCRECNDNPNTKEPCLIGLVLLEKLRNEIDLAHAWLWDEDPPNAIS